MGRKAYISMAGISTIIREFCLPNPFEKMTDKFVINNIEFTPTILNWIAEPIIYVITFALVGLYYTKGFDSPVKGSFLYLIFYIIHFGLLWVMACFNFSIVAVILVLLGYAFLHIAFIILKNKLSGGI